MTEELNNADGQFLFDTTRGAIVAWLRQYMADLTELDIAEIDIDGSFERYGFDSYQGVVMTHELGAWLGNELDATDTFDHPTIAKLAEFLAADPDNQAALARHGQHG